jgi:hypothetical protein
MSDQIATVKLDGHIGAFIQLVPNEMEGSARVEVYNMRGLLLAHQKVDGTVDKDQAADIGFSLFNGFIFGYRACEQRVRTGVELLLGGPDNPLA